MLYLKKTLSTAVTLPATPRLRQNCETQLRAVHFERAGLLDAEMMSFTPALRIDYNFYQITAVTITDSLSDGVHINYIHPYETARLEYMQVRLYTLLPHFLPEWGICRLGSTLFCLIFFPNGAYAGYTVHSFASFSSPFLFFSPLFFLYVYTCV